MANITKRGSSYTITVSLGIDGTGKRLRKSLTYTPPPSLTPKQAEKEAKRQAAIFEERCRTGQVLETNTRFSEFVEIWLRDYAEKQLEPRTLSRYKELLKRINAAFGNTKISAIQPHHLTAFYNNLAEKGIREDIKYKANEKLEELVKETALKRFEIAHLAGISESSLRNCLAGNNISQKTAGKIAAYFEKSVDELFTSQEDKCLSNNTILYYHRVLSSVFSTAVQWQVIFSNPCERVKPPKVKRKEARYLDEYEAAELLKALDGEPFKYVTMIQLLLYTGLRRSELMGLEWQDIDFLNRCIHVSRNSLYLSDKGLYEGNTKTESSNRVIKLPDNAVQLLKEYRQYQDSIIQEMGTAWQGTGRLFTTKDGKPMHPDTLSGWFHEFVKRKGLPDVSVHSLRHTHATLMIAAGVNIKTVSSRLGHASVTTTGNIYTHAIKSADEAAAEIINDILTPSGKSNRIKVG